MSTLGHSNSAQVVLVKDVETTLCSTYERWAAFEASMGGGGSGDASDPDAGSGLVRRPLVLLGGCALGNSAAQAAPAARSVAAHYDHAAACVCAQHV